MATWDVSTDSKLVHLPCPVALWVLDTLASSAQVDLSDFESEFEFGVWNWNLFYAVFRFVPFLMEHKCTRQEGGLLFWSVEPYLASSFIWVTHLVPEAMGESTCGSFYRGGDWPPRHLIWFGIEDMGWIGGKSGHLPSWCLAR